MRNAPVVLLLAIAWTVSSAAAAKEPAVPARNEAVGAPVPPGCLPSLTEFGCANARNLALMAARPADLDRPQAAAPPAGDGALLAAKRYRQGQTKPLKAESTGATGAQ